MGVFPFYKLVVWKKKKQTLRRPKVRNGLILILYEMSNLVESKKIVYGKNKLYLLFLWLFPKETDQNPDLWSGVRLSMI